MITERVERVTDKDPAQREWYVNEEEINVWVDVSSLASGLLLEKDKAAFEDMCWLPPANDAWHISLTELDAMVKGINIAPQWHAKRLHTDCFSVDHWVSNMLTGKARICTKAACEIRWRQDT